MAGARDFEDPVSACLFKTLKNALIVLTALTDLKSIKAAGNSAIFFQDRLKNISIEPQVRLAAEGESTPRLSL
jgi:hypothetical protein